MEQWLTIAPPTEGIGLARTERATRWETEDKRKKSEARCIGADVKLSPQQTRLVAVNLGCRMAMGSRA